MPVTLMPSNNRTSYDSEPRKETASEPAAASSPKAARAAKPAKTSGFYGILKTAAVIAGSSIVAVIAVDVYRKFKGGGGGDGTDPRQLPAPVGQLPAAMPGQTFIPMPMPFPMPMMMGGGYGMQQPMPPRRNLSEEEEEKLELKQFARQGARAKLERERARRKLDEMVDEFENEER
jgi:hypothetical protein